MPEPPRQSTAAPKRYAIVVTSRCRALIEVEATSKSEARAKARRLDLAEGRGFDGWQIVTTPLHVEAGAAMRLEDY
jgi:hypothetical protein